MAGPQTLQAGPQDPSSWPTDPYSWPSDPSSWPLDPSSWPSDSLDGRQIDGRMDGWMEGKMCAFVMFHLAHLRAGVQKPKNSMAENKKALIVKELLFQHVEFFYIITIGINRLLIVL